MCVFFFKQKTAYEMRISDWSSDVCSSDLGFFRRSQAMNDLFRKTALPVILLASTVLFAGCATQGKPPPVISLDEPVQAQPLPEPPAPVEVVAVPEVLPMPAQLKPVPEAEDAKPAPEPADEDRKSTRLNSSH